ncbi:circadian clock-controlled protein daywake [Anabrus simplex]|uniref:circadian clock-controlled protein daywake n=1 Tax=Anabrus simplex TaxID=316456 RepID=UPI0035A2E2D1
MAVKYNVRLLFVVLCISCAVADQLPSYIKKCKLNDEKCYVESAQAALPHFVNGDKKVKLQPLNPFVIEKIEVEQGGLKIKLTDVKLYFTDDLKILSVRADFKNHKFEYTFSSPVCKLLSDYEIDGKILVVPISGKGKANITVVDVVLHFSHDTLHEKREDGKKYVKFLTGQHETKNITRAYFDLTNLFNGDKTLSEHTLKFMNENWKDVYTELNPLLLDALVEQEKLILNNVAGTVPLDELFYPE